MIDLSKIIGFDWDEGNSRKNSKYGISMSESEQIFFNAPLLLLADVKHSQQEPRFHALGKTHQGRLLHITFTLRQQNKHIRVISARDMHKKERSIYEQAS
ncbi:MAG: BrnT family toxin [Methylococcales bacterium]